MKRNVYLLLLAAAFFSCKKSTTNNNNCVISVSTISGVYKTIAITYKSSPTDPPADQFTSLPDCQKDETIEMGADGSLQFSDAGMGCGIPPPPGSPTGWTLESNNTYLNFADQAFFIQSFNCKQLVLVENGVFIIGDSRTTTLEKQ